MSKLIVSILAFVFMTSTAFANNVIEARDHMSYRQKEWVMKWMVKEQGKTQGTYQNYIWAMIKGKLATASLNEVRKCPKHRAQECAKELLFDDYTNQMEQAAVVNALMKLYMSQGMDFSSAALIVKHTTGIPIGISSK